MVQKKKTAPKHCVYGCPCAHNCHETSLYCRDEKLKESVGKNGVAGYDIIYIANTASKQVFMFGNAAGVLKQGADISGAGCAMHDQSFKRAAAGKVAVYEWSQDYKGKSVYFQSTLIPLFDERGTVSNVLGLVKNITPWAKALPSAPSSLLKEVGGHTFSQILLAAREEEKKNISKALHDEIGSMAVILTSLLSMVKDSVKEGNKKQALADIARLDGQIKDSIDRIKNIIVSLRPPHLDSSGLRGALEELLANMQAYSGIKCKFKSWNDDFIPMSDNVKIMLYRVVQEALNNIMKHARAKTVSVTLKKDAHNIHLTIADDGVGFKPPRQQSIRKVGLLAMRDSVAYLGGSFDIQSEPGKGTVIDVVCPRIVYDGGTKK